MLNILGTTTKVDVARSMRHDRLKCGSPPPQNKQCLINNSEVTTDDRYYEASPPVGSVRIGAFMTFMTAVREPP